MKNVKKKIIYYNLAITNDNSPFHSEAKKKLDKNKCVR